MPNTIILFQERQQAREMDGVLFTNPFSFIKG